MSVLYTLKRARCQAPRYGRTVPRGAELRRVGTFLAPATNAGRLSAAYDGAEADDDASTVQEALERHTAAVERQNELLERLLEAIGSGAVLVGQALTKDD